MRLIFVFGFLLFFFLRTFALLDWKSVNTNIHICIHTHVRNSRVNVANKKKREKNSANEIKNDNTYASRATLPARLYVEFFFTFLLFFFFFFPKRIKFKIIKYALNYPYETPRYIYAYAYIV